MEINRLTLPKNVAKTFTEEVDFSNEKFNPYFIHRIEKAIATAEVTQYDDLMRVVLTVEAKVIAVCAYTLEEVELNVKGKDELDFLDEDEEGYYHEEKEIFSLDPYILTLILSRVPSKVIKKGASLPDDGNGYRVLSEEDYKKEQEKKSDHRWDALDNLEL